MQGQGIELEALWMDSWQMLQQVGMGAWEQPLINYTVDQWLFPHRVHILPSSFTLSLRNDHVPSWPRTCPRKTPPNDRPRTRKTTPNDRPTHARHRRTIHPPEPVCKRSRALVDLPRHDSPATPLASPYRPRTNVPPHNPAA